MPSAMSWVQAPSAIVPIVRPYRAASHLGRSGWEARMHGSAIQEQSRSRDAGDAARLGSEAPAASAAFWRRWTRGSSRGGQQAASIYKAIYCTGTQALAMLYSVPTP
jgi:hypothetical protein